MFRTHMPTALAEAAAAARRGETPVGAAVVHRTRGAVIARAGNACRALNDPTAHAEILALRSAASALARDRLDGCDLWVTLEPCAMCAGAIVLARIDRLYIGAIDPKGGGVLHGAQVFDQPQANHRPEVYAGIAAEASAAMLRAFFQARRG